MQELKKHGVSLKELPLPQLLDGLQARRGKRDDSFSAVEMHPLATLMQNALEAFVVGKVRFQLRHLYAVEYLLSCAESAVCKINAMPRPSKVLGCA